ncbi:alpha/beta hydrolase [Cellulomonas sp. KRMCY2]|uniref:alpha/beta hydrolase n=1 Tax=Cellulomonas sp. KRMCY2 TaxID=1304865 RepID=UPI001E4CEE2B|nr:alpha/beta hydrolase [Cellulomonas sp. KRMCY2]
MSNARRTAHLSTEPSRTLALRLVAMSALVGVVLAGCVAPKEQTKPDRTSPETTSAPDDQADDPVEQGPDLAGAGIDAYYDQAIAWSDCGDGYECATVQAPLDWDVPETGAIELAIKRSAATGPAGARVGSLLINPGGPGGSGIEFLDSAVNGMFGQSVLDAYDIVAFDPRGVGESSAVDCGDDSVVDAFFTADLPIESQADVEAAREAVRVFGEGCLAATGPLLGEVDTVSAARDMDLLRAVLGDEKLYYAGFSYGTFLGATYAGLYPENVGRLLLDGALDPSMSNDDLVIGQAIGFENALRAYVKDCQAGADCPLTGGVDAGMQQIADLVARIEAKPIDAGGDLKVNGTMAFYGIVVTLYDDGSWTFLTQALDEAIRDNIGEMLLYLANFYLDRTDDGAYLSNSMIAFNSINCLDYPMPVRDYDELAAFAAEVEAVAPTFGKDFGLAIGCETWPFQSTVERERITAPGAEPILVVGTTGDPATPYEWSVALAEQLESGTLLSWEGEGHTAYGRANDCLNDAVDAYLVQGVVPADGLVC